MGCSRFYNSNYFKETSKNRETFFIYLIWYSIGRFFVEGLRTDSLMLTSHIRVAQLVSVILIVVSIILIVYRRVKYHPSTLKILDHFNGQAKGVVCMVRRLNKQKRFSINPLWQVYKIVRFPKVFKQTIIIEISRFIPSMRLKRSIYRKFLKWL